MRDFLSTHLKKLWRLIVPVAFVALAIWRFDLQEVATKLVESDLRLVVIAWTVGFAMVVLWSWRWRLLLKSYDIHYSLPRAVELYLIGMFAGFFFSDSVGGFARGLYVKKDGYHVSEAMMTVFLDKMLEIASLLVFGMIGLILFPSILSQHWIVWVVLVGGICSIAGIVWAIRGSLGNWISEALDVLLRNRLSEGNSLSRLYDGLCAIAPLTWMQMFLISLAGRLAHYVSAYLLIRALDIPISLLSTVGVMSMVGIAVTLPISVGAGLGTRDATLVGLFALLGQPPESALSLSFLLLVCSLTRKTVGLILWLRRPLRWSDKHVDAQSAT